MDAPSQQDSPLSISANIVGLLTFLIAVSAATYARVTYLRSGDDEFLRVKASLSWYKTESQWLADLLAAVDPRREGLRSYRPPYHMYTFVMDDLLNLERRLLDVVAEVEERASGGGRGDWTVVPRRWRAGGTSAAVAWLSVRTKALELVRQRERLTTRVQFLQMGMVSTQLRDVEARLKWGEMKADESSRKVEGLRDSQAEEIRRLQDMMIHPNMGPIEHHSAI